MVWNLDLFDNPFIEAAVFLTASAGLKIRKQIFNLDFMRKNWHTIPKQAPFDNGLMSRIEI
jgi:hypothetical protein